MICIDSQLEIDWNAVAALGTWAVGVIGAVLAWQANRLGKALRASDDKRAENAAKAILVNVRQTFLNFKWELDHAIEAFDKVVADGDVAIDSIPSIFERLEIVKKGDEGLRPEVLAWVPQALAQKIAFHWGQVDMLQGSFRRQANLARIVMTSPEYRANMLEATKQSNEQLRAIAANVTDVADEIGKILGIPLQTTSAS